MSSHQDLKMPPLRDLPMPWRLGESEERKFWKVQNVAMGGDLGLGCPPPGVRLEEVGRRIPWMPPAELAEEGSPLPPLGPGPMEVDGAEQALGDGDAWGRPQTARRLTPRWPMIASPEPAGPFVWGGLVSCWWGMWEWEGCATVQNRLD